MALSRTRSALYSAIVVLAFFGVIEAALRVIGVKKAPRPRLILRSIDTDVDLPFMQPDPELFWSPRPGFRGEFQGRPVTINALGLRGAEPAMRRPACRILCLGDSITFGYGVGDDETYPAALARTLAGRDVEVLNGGVTGYTSHQSRKLLERVGPALRPDVVTVCIGWNDRTRRAGSDRDYERRLRWASRAEGLADHLFLYRALSGLYAGARVAGGAMPRDIPRVDPVHYRANLAGIVRDAQALGARPVFIALPHRSRFEGPPLDPAYPQALREAAAALGVPLAEAGVLGDAAPPGGNESFFIDSLHLSPAGADEMARALATDLAAAGVLDGELSK
jgi:lysophospholipase L1-like esterase